MSIQQFFRRTTGTFAAPYKVTKPLKDISQELNMPVGQILKLDAGENIWVPKRIQQAIQSRIAVTSVATYPDSESTALRDAVAIKLGVDPTWIMVGNGSDELIDLCCRIFINPGDSLVDCPPTFPMYWFFARTMGAKRIEVQRDVSFRIKIQETRQALGTGKLLFVATPNNPTGTLTDEKTLRILLESGKPIVVDEAYIEFGGITCLPLLQEFDNLIVLRTFSKWAGIAGVRVGFLVARPQVIDAIRAIRPPYSVNTVAQVAALCVLEKEKEILPVIRELQASRDWFISQA